MTAPTAWFDLPPEWRRLRDRTWILRATGHDFDVAGRLDEALDQVENYLAAVGLGARYAWGLVPAPATAKVEAALTVGLVNLAGLPPGDAARVYRAAAEGAGVESQAAESVDRRVREGRCAAGLVVTIHDFVLDRRGGATPNPAVERGIVTLFPEGSPVGYEFSIQTQDLTAFDDLVGYLTGLVETIRAA